MPVAMGEVVAQIICDEAANPGHRAVGVQCQQSVVVTQRRVGASAQTDMQDAPQSTQGAHLQTADGVVQSVGIITAATTVQILDDDRDDEKRYRVENIVHVALFSIVSV